MHTLRGPKSTLPGGSITLLTSSSTTNRCNSCSVAARRWLSEFRSRTCVRRHRATSTAATGTATTSATANAASATNTAGVKGRLVRMHLSPAPQ
jgi:hypothetical protein